MTKTVEMWIEHARYDMESATVMLSADRHIYVMFFCQQAIEKALKAVIMDRTKKAAPRTHNLTKLVALAGVEADQSQIDLMSELSSFYVQSRYPETLESTLEPVGREQAETLHDRSKEMLEWLLLMLK